MSDGIRPGNGQAFRQIAVFPSAGLAKWLPNVTSARCDLTSARDFSDGRPDRPSIVSDRPRIIVVTWIFSAVLDRVRLGGTLLFHFELGHPWNLELPERPYALFHYLSHGSATLALEQGKKSRPDRGHFAVITRGEPHLISRIAGPSLCGLWILIDCRRVSGSVRHGGRAKPLSTMLCGNFTVSRPMFGSLLDSAGAPAEADRDSGWLEAVLRRMVSESAHERPGQHVALSRLTEVLFVEVLRSWIKSLTSRPRRLVRGDIGPAYRTGAATDPRTPGAALDPARPRAARGARSLGLFGALQQTGRPVDAALCDRTPDGGGRVPARNHRRRIARIASRVGYETAAAFSKLFHRHHGMSPGRYRAAQRLDQGKAQAVVSGIGRLSSAPKRKSAKR